MFPSVNAQHLEVCALMARMPELQLIGFLLLQLHAQVIIIMEYSLKWTILITVCGWGYFWPISRFSHLTVLHLIATVSRQLYSVVDA